ncbi:MAG: Gfo/Idh/MocA family oxidoreductase [Kurthia sp.]|nr:Gfo/Idh/MocA family oxidoreductase [Candidatus Kurthia equi]
MKKVKWGILSTANIALTQLVPAIERAINAEVVAIASRGPKVHAIADELKIERAYESYEELLADEDIEVIYIPLPNNLHKEWAMKAATAGKNVLCEKPVVLAQQDLEEIIQHFEKHGKLFMEAFMYQFHPQHQRVKDIVASGEIGDVKLYKSSHSFYFENSEGDIRMDKEKGGGALWDVGCYSLHALQYHLGADVEQMTFRAKYDEATGVDVSAYGIIEYKNDVTAVIDCSFDMVGRNTYEIVGTKGSIQVKNAFRPDTFGGDAQVIITTGMQERTEYIQGDIYKLEVEYFSNLVRQGGSLHQQHMYSRQTTKLLLQGHASLEGV